MNQNMNMNECAAWYQQKYHLMTHEKNEYWLRGRTMVSQLPQLVCAFLSVSATACKLVEVIVASVAHDLQSRQVEALKRKQILAPHWKYLHVHNFCF